MYEAKAAETVCGNARALQIGKLYATRIANYDVLYITFAVNECAYLAARLMRELA
jgi:hypothetical protein